MMAVKDPGDGKMSGGEVVACFVQEGLDVFPNKPVKEGLYTLWSQGMMRWWGVLLADFSHCRCRHALSRGRICNQRTKSLQPGDASATREDRVLTLANANDSSFSSSCVRRSVPPRVKEKGVELTSLIGNYSH